jgi:hypothetical protein
MATARLIETLSTLELFAPAFLKIKDKDGLIVPFEFNRAQVFTNKRLNDQLEATGKVRALVLKGRQMGLSTLIEARYFHKIITTRGKKAFILSHEAEATKNLFAMTQRYHNNLPAGLCPKADLSSSKELYFRSLDSGYTVATAGNAGAGRSQTVQLFHGSEVAFWPHVEDHIAGALQTVPSSDNSEIILESTANGIGNVFHSMWIDAIRGKSEYQAIFNPWYWMKEYSKKIEGFKPSDDERHLMEVYSKEGLTWENLCWRRLKIAEFASKMSNNLSAGFNKFKQEYPFTAQEAFLNPITETFINSEAVMEARNNRVESDTGMILGVDPALGGNDRSAIIRRKGRLAYNLETFYNHNTMELAAKIKRIIEIENPLKVYIDCIGIGAGVTDRLREMGYEFVEGVNVARKSNNPELFKNLKAELCSEMREWFNQEMPVQVPDLDDLHADLCSFGYDYDTQNRLVIESKEKLRNRGMPSPDCADALMLTFYSGFYEPALSQQSKKSPEWHRKMFT